VISSSNATDPGPAIRSTADLATSIGEEIAEFEALQKLLQEEQEALKAPDVDRVYALAMAKNDRLARLGALGNARTRFLESKGLGANGAETQAYLNSAVRESWRRLLALASTARDTNALNGKLIALQLRYTSGALAVLQEAASNLMCYGADGTTRSLRTGRSLASA